MRAFLTEFCNNSTIHGVRYFTERSRHWSERCWWAIAICASIYLCGDSIQTYWINWNEAPVTLNFAEKDRPISAIPFPTVFICPGIKAIKGKLDLVDDFFESPEEYTKNFSNIQWSRLDAIGLVCDWSEDFFEFRSKFANDSIYYTIKEIASAFNETLIFCSSPVELGGTCSELFTLVWTENGLCYAFNALNYHETYTDKMATELKITTENPNVSHWSLDNGYETTSVNENEYPIRVFSGKSVHLFAAIWLLNNDVGSNCGSGDGISIGFTVPGDSLKLLDLFYIEMKQSVNVLIKPKLVTTSNKLQKYSPNQRQCFFDSERRLAFFKFYTQDNCEAECLANFTHNECGCVKYSMPREKSTKICGPGYMGCYRDAAKKLFGIDIIDGMKDKAARSFRENCNCLPACTAIKYDTEIEKIKNENELIGGLETLLTISFQNPYVSTLQRIETYNFTDFLAVCGGLLGLFLGVSVLSIIEFVYYFTLRLFWTIRKSKSKNKVVAFKRKRTQKLAHRRF